MNGKYISTPSVKCCKRILLSCLGTPRAHFGLSRRVYLCVRCREAVEDKLVQLRELQRQLQRKRDEREELEERNEELEALLGETQNASKEERHRHEGELEGLHRRVTSSFQTL